MTRIFTPVVLTTADSDWGPVHIAAGATGIVGAGMLATAEGFHADLERRGYVELVPLEAASSGPARDLAVRARDAVTALLDGVRTIPRGTTASYGEVARRIGRPGAARAVGGAVGRSPIGVLVPCHRVIAGDGTLGGYGAAAWGGVEAALDLKHALLRLEGVEVPRRATG